MSRRIAEPSLNIAIVGAGLMGGALGRAWARQGHRVTFSFTRDLARLSRLARDVGGGARAASPADAVSTADVILLAVPWHQLDAALHSCGPLAGRTLMSCSMPMLSDDSALAIGHVTSGAEELATISGAHVVSAFTTVPSELISAMQQGATLAGGGPPNVLYCGDHADAKRRCLPLMRSAGFEPIDIGALQGARLLEPMGLAIARVAYREGGDPALGYMLREATTALAYRQP